MKPKNIIAKPDSSAVRTALWRAIHLQVDEKPYIIEDRVGLQLVEPDEGWQQRPDMHPQFTKRLRASMVARARFIEDLIVEQFQHETRQYVILGAGLDTFAQRRTEVASKLQIFEIDQAETQMWKQQRLNELGFGVPEWLHFVSVDFETMSWWDELLKSGFNLNESAVVVCTGVTLYLTKEAVTDMLNQFTKLAKGSKIAVAFYLPLELLDDEDKPLQMISEKGARESGTPFVSFFAPDKLLELADEAGLKDIKTIFTKDMEVNYFSGRSDNLLPASGEYFLMATI